MVYIAPSIVMLNMLFLVSLMYTEVYRVVIVAYTLFFHQPLAGLPLFNLCFSALKLGGTFLDTYSSDNVVVSRALIVASFCRGAFLTL